MPLDQRSTLRRLPGLLNDWPAEQILAWTLDTFGERCAIISALQVEGVVIMDLARRLLARPRVLTIDTGRLPQETHDFIATLQATLGVRVEVLVPNADEVSAMANRWGTNLFRHDPALRQLCCHVRKVLPLERALHGLDAWMSGLRRDGGAARTRIAKAEVDPVFPDIIKVNPLADWSRADVWAYVRRHRLPVHPLHEQGYSTIGCLPCTRAVKPGEPERSGRWWWEPDEERECGIHGGDRKERFEGAIARLHADTRQP